MKKIVSFLCLFPIAIASWLISFNIGLNYQRVDRITDTQKKIDAVKSFIQKDVIRTGRIPTNENDLEEIILSKDESLLYDAWGQKFIFSVSNRQVSIWSGATFDNGVKCRIGESFSIDTLL